MGAEEKALDDRLSKLSGAAFDRAYMKAMVDDHVKDVSEFKKEAKSGTDPEVKAWAAKTLPTLEEHLKMAREANGAVGTSREEVTLTSCASSSSMIFLNASNGCAPLIMRPLM